MSNLFFGERGKRMIKITNIKLYGFKNIGNVDLELKDLATVIGVNNFGKSNMLDGIDFGIDFINFSPKAKQREMSDLQNVPIIEKLVDEKFKFEISFDTCEDNQTSVIYGYSFSWIDQRGDNKGEIVNEYLKVKQKGKQKYTSYIDRNLDKSFYLASESGRCTKKIQINKNELIINKIQAFDDLFYFNIVKSLNDLTIYIDRNFDSKILYLFKPFVIKGDDKLSPFSDNVSIAETLYELKEKHFKKYLLIENVMLELFPHIKEFYIDKFKFELNEDFSKVQLEDSPFSWADNQYFIKVMCKNYIKTIDISQMSDGVKRILTLLTYITLAEINKIPIIAIEEPENSVHPGLLKKYLSVINQVAGDCRVILTSHSPYLVNYIDKSNLYLGAPDDSGVANFKQLKKKYFRRIEEYAQELDVEVGEYLFMLMSSNDEMDYDILKRYLSDE